MAQSDSDDENDPFSMFKIDKILNIEEDDVQQVESTASQQSVILNAKSSVCSIIDDLFLRKDIYGLEALTNEPERLDTSEECEEAHR
jgi:hypothetical protein